jgi:hypothetical protein
MSYIINTWHGYREDPPSSLHTAIDEFQNWKFTQQQDSVVLLHICLSIIILNKNSNDDDDNRMLEFMLPPPNAKCMQHVMCYILSFHSKHNSTNKSVL